MDRHGPLGMTSARVLVVLPTLGERLDTLEETFASIEEQRSGVGLRVVLVAPESATGARDLAHRYGATIVDDPRAGMSAAMNAGIAAADGETYYAWMGDDDKYRPEGLATLARMLDEDARAAVAYGGCDYIDPAGRVIGTSAAGRLARWLLPWGPDLVPNPAAMIRLDALRSAGEFDVRLRYAMDLDMFLRLRPHGRFVSTRRVVAAFRWHPDSLTVANRAASSQESEAVKRRHLPAPLRPLSPLWDLPVRWASRQAAVAVSRRAHSIARSQEVPNAG